MGLRVRNGKWYYRFQLDGRNYAGTTDLPATQRNVSRAQAIVAEHRTALLDGRKPQRRIVVREFSDAKTKFPEWAKAHYREHPNSARRIAVSLSSANEFFDREPVSMNDEGRVEAYKAWRFNEHDVRGITVRHDLHALSTFFQYAMKQHWTRDNPIANVEIPSDAEAVRIHVLTDAEEKLYFAHAAKHPDLYDLGRLMINQGMRPEEVLSLPKFDVHLERGQVQNPARKISGCSSGSRFDAREPHNSERKNVRYRNMDF